jgi:hypothetical protein
MLQPSARRIELICKATCLGDTYDVRQVEIAGQESGGLHGIRPLRSYRIERKTDEFTESDEAHFGSFPVGAGEHYLM